MNAADKPRLMVIAGPTATGKSELAVRAAKLFNGEIISADSIQVYRGLDIGSAKVSAPEMEGVPHHLIDVMDFTEDYNVSIFKEMAKKAAAGIYKRGRLPVVCGGTGFYIQAFLYDIDFEDEPAEAEDSYRRYLENIYNEGGAETLLGILRDKDPLSYERLDRSNIKRVIRALEYMHFHGRSIQEHNDREKLKKNNPPYDCLYFVLCGDRKKMYERIERRVDKMIEAGLYDEVKRLYESGLNENHTAAQGIGYREMLRCVKGEISIEEAAEEIKKNTRHFAKRQLTWFRREENAIWIDIDKGDALDELKRNVRLVWNR